MSDPRQALSRARPLDGDGGGGAPGGGGSGGERGEGNPVQALEGVVTRAQSGFYEVATAPGAKFTAVLRGRMRKERRTEGLIALGDRVRVEPLVQPEGETGNVDAVIVERLKRRTVLVRRAPGPKGAWALHVVVANIDRLLPTFAVRQPEPSLRMVDRFLALAELEGIEAVPVFNKVDLGTPESVERAMGEYRRIGYTVLGVSAMSGEGIDELRDQLHSGVSAFVGPSGAGKSSLLNAVEPGLALRIGSVSDAVGKGKHTTRVGQLIALSGGGLVADTPGLREIGLGELDAESLAWAFREFRDFATKCHFANCTHVREPSCAVRAAVESGDVSARRHESYLRLLADADA